MKEVTTAGKTAPRKFDFSKYRSREFVAKISEILNIQGSLVSVVRTTAYLELGLLFTLIAGCVMFADMAILEYFLLSIFLLFVGVMFGVPLGLLRVVQKSLANIEDVLNVLLDASKNAALDFSDLRSGDVEIPSGKEIVSGMYEQVLMPTLEEVVSEVFGFLGAPLLWMYRKTIGAAVSRMMAAAYIKEHGITDERPPIELLHTEEVNEAAKEIAERSRPALEYIESARSVVSSVSGGLRSYAIRPLLIIFWISLLIALSPIVFYILIFGMPTE